jgi:F-type H+-transporting ATPase subunit epsilon
MSATFSWSVATPEGAAASGECEFLVVPTSGGELGVMAGHAALVARVVPGDLRVTESSARGAVLTVSVGAGVVDVRDNRVRLLVAAASRTDSAASRTDSSTTTKDSASSTTNPRAAAGPGPSA